MKILFTEPPIEEVDKEGLKILAKFGNIVVAPNTDEQTLQREVEDADVLVTRLARVTASVIENAPNLKVIGRTGAGVDNIDVETATHRGIPVVNVPAINADSVAEHTFGLILAISRCIPMFDAEVRKGNWRARDDLISFNSELYGKTLGVIGFGAIGSRVAKLAVAFGMKVLAYDPYVSLDTLQKVGAVRVEVRDLLKESDVITIHASRTKETYHMISDDAFRLMKKSSMLINCSRGDVVDENALLKALEEGTIRGAGLDVFESEPLPPNNPLLNFDNVIATPHVAGFTREARVKTMVTLAHDIGKILTGQEPTNLANRDGLLKGSATRRRP